MKNNTYIILSFGFLYSVFSNFIIESIICFILLAFITHLFNKKNVPFAIQFYFLFFFIQIFSVFALLDFTDSTINDLTSNFNLKSTIEISLISMFQLSLMSIVFSYIFNSKHKFNKLEIINSISRYDFKKLFVFYIFMSFLFPLISTFTSKNASIQQFFMALAVLKDVVLLLFAFHFSFFKKHRRYIILIFLFEFLIGFISYFSSFKTILFYILIVSLTQSVNLSFNKILKLSPIVLFIIIIMSFWSNVKGEYRYFISNGQIGQSINVNAEDASDFIFTKLSTFNFTDFKNGFTLLLRRTQYIEEYQTVRQKVPTIIPHQKGRLTSDAIMFNLTPRFLNPNKKVLDPSSKTSEFTMRQVTNVEQGTSISLGFFADFYIDYGFWGMTLALIAISIILAFFFRWVLFNTKYSIVFNLSLLIAIITHIGTFESDLIFFLGSIRNYLVVYIFCNKFVFSSLIKYFTTVSRI